MAESLVNTKRRIATIKSTKKITKAMKLVASVKFQRWKKYLDDNSAYIENMENTLFKTLKCVDFSDESIKLPTLFKSGEKDNNLYIIISSTLGLCGAYNYNLFKEIDSKITESDELFIIGEKAVTHYSNKKNTKYLDYVDIYDNFTYSAVRRMRHQIIRLYKKNGYKNVYLVYTHYQNSIAFIPTIESILPFNKQENIDDKTDDSTIFEPDVLKLLETLIPHYIDAYLYNKMLETELSELASRRNAMEAATDSADKIQNQLQLEYNKARQNAITQEITEVVAGANSGKKE